MTFNQALERFEYFLKLRGLSLTRERRQILEAICDRARHFTADDLFFSMHAAGKKTSKATLYRTLQLLLEGRIIREAPLSARQAVYELSEPGAFHGHLVCQNCDKVVEFTGPTLERFVREASINNHFLPLTAQIKFLGFCNECVKANPPSMRSQVCVPILKYEQTREVGETGAATGRKKQKRS